MLVPNAGSEESLNLPRRVALSSGRSSAQGGDWPSASLPPVHVAEYGRQQPPWFFLKSSSWFQRRRADRAALENDIDPDSPPNDSFEPVSAEFHGKEAVR